MHTCSSLYSLPPSALHSITIELHNVSNESSNHQPETITVYDFISLSLEISFPRSTDVDGRLLRYILALLSLAAVITFTINSDPDHRQITTQHPSLIHEFHE
jgi:hypothetical protein